MDRPLTGVGYRALHLLRALFTRNDGFDVRLFAARARNTPKSAFPFDHGFTRQTTVPYFRRLKTVLWPSVEWPPIEWFCGDVDLAHGLFHELPAARRALRLVTIHDLSFLLFPETHTKRTVALQTRLVRHCARRADAFVAVSESCKNDLIRTLDVSEDKVFVVPGGVCVEEFQAPVDARTVGALKQRLGLTRDYFIYLGTIEPRKNLARLLEAYARVRNARRDCPQLLLVGKTGWLSKQVLATLETLDAGNDVVHTGYLEREEALMLLRDATACVYPSLYEGFGLPVVEAMAARTPVITSNAAAVVEVSGGTCLHVDAEDVDAIEDGIVQVLDAPDAAKRRAEGAYARAGTMTWHRSAEKLAQVYTTLAKTGR